MEITTRFVRRMTPRHIRARLGRAQAWRIAVTRGVSPLELSGTDVAYSMVLDRGALVRHGIAFIADPFAIKRAGCWHVFFEVMHNGNGVGQIALATSRDLVNWDYAGVVLAEPFHLSYPFVFEDEGETYLIPESADNLTVRLYRAVGFPRRWEQCRVLLSNGSYKDNTLLRHDGHLYMFTETSRHHGHDLLRLYVAEGLDRPWVEHPRSPLTVGNADVGRPAGRMVTVDGTLLRLSQCCSERYGRAVRAHRLLELTPSTYRELPAPGVLLHEAGFGWNASGMHHLDAQRIDGEWVCFVDGYS